MRWLLLIALMLTFILFFGCLGPSAPPAPPYKAPVKQNNTVTNNTPLPPPAAVTPPAKPSGPLVPPKNVTKPATPPATPPAANTTPPAANITSPPSNPATPAAPSICGGTGGSDQLECIILAAIAQKEVRICTQLTLSTDRYKCFTRWCYSGARDYKQCQALPNNDDRLGCLNKCNPNFNT